jgi:glutamine synthetase
MPDPACNPYLAMSALMLAGLDGIERGLLPGNHTDKNLYDMSPEELATIKHAPASLGEALDALEKDHDFLTKGGVFNIGFLNDYISGKRAEVADQAKWPTAREFYAYYDV